MHDLRRTFGRVAEEITSYAVVKRLLNHRNTTDPTERYAQPDQDRIYEALQKLNCIYLNQPLSYMRHC